MFCLVAEERALAKAALAMTHQGGCMVEVVKSTPIKSGIKIDAEYMVESVSGEKYSFQLGSKLDMKAGAESNFAFNVSTVCNVDAVIEILNKKYTFNLGKWFCSKEKTEVDVTSTEVALDHTEITLGNDVTVANHQLDTTNTQLALTNDSLSTTNTQVERNATAITSNTNQIDKVQTQVSDISSQVNKVNNRLESVQTVISKRTNAITQCQSTISNSDTTIQSSKLLMLG